MTLTRRRGGLKTEVKRPGAARGSPALDMGLTRTGRRAGIDPLSIAEIARAAAEAKKAQNVLLLDVQDLTIIADYFVIVSGTSRTQVKAIADAVLRELKEQGVLPRHREGTVEAGWIILDYADTVVHIFHAREREYYDLERLYRGSPEVGSRAEVNPGEVRGEARGS